MVIMNTSPMARPSMPTNNRYSTIFQPPQDESPKPSQLSQSGYFSTVSRKRLRSDSSMGQQSANMYDTWQTPGRIRDAQDGECGFSTESLVNDRYRLQDGFDTPGLFANGDPETTEEHSRKTIQEPSPAMRMTEPVFGPLARERNGHARGTSTRSWTRFAFTLPISIAGKVFSFGSTVLKGFTAGPGQGYILESDTRMPGSWYEGPADHDSDVEPNNTPIRPPPNKRRLTDKDWVVVNAEDPPESPMRKPATPRSRPRSRRSMVRRQSSGLERVQTTRTTGHISPTPLSPTGFPSPDAERFARRQAKQERATDRAVHSMSRQLEELIRQGQAALGSKVSIEDDASLEDEGYVDDE